MQARRTNADYIRKTIRSKILRRTRERDGEGRNNTRSEEQQWGIRHNRGGTVTLQDKDTFREHSMNRSAHAPTHREKGSATPPLIPH